MKISMGIELLYFPFNMSAPELNLCSGPADIFHRVTIRSSGRSRMPSRHIEMRCGMQVDQTKLLDSLSYSHNTQENTKGIENYIAQGADKSGGVHVAGAAKKDDETSIHAAETVDMSQTTYSRPTAEHDKTVADTLTTDDTSAAERSNEMAVVANTTSEADLKQMQEDGYSVADTDTKTIITVTDKIKTALAKAGVDISAYGDTLSEEQLAEITGSVEVARQIAAQLMAQDLPQTAQNINDMADAGQKAEQLAPLGEDAISYLIKNELPPTIANIYRAEYSISEKRNGRAAMSDADFAQLQDQIAQIIQSAGLDVNGQTLQDSRFLLEQGLPLTADNLAYLQDLRAVSDQIAGWKENGMDDAIYQNMCDAIAEGAHPIDAMLADGWSLSDRARESTQIVEEATDEDIAYVLAKDQPLTIENLKAAENVRKSGTAGKVDIAGERNSEITENAKQILSEQGLAFLTAKRQLEETRLAMTSEANYALLKKGISIDTKPLVELVDDLKGQEGSYYQKLLESEGIDTEENVAVFKETCQVLDDLKTAPAYVIRPRTVDTLNSLHEAGMEQKNKFDKANESYETLMTAPRKDMGDSIQKAFANVDDILKDLGLDTSEANRRAVRILAYNNTELTPENIALVKAKDEAVNRAFTGLTPKVVVEMIRKGINPLDMDMDTLNQTAVDVKSELGDEDTERYQKYLWKLEQNNDISEEERSSYIGIYRLIAQVEKTDGAAIGSLMQQGAPITMRSLLTAVRTGNKGSMDYQVDDQFSGVDNVAKNERIDDQIMAAYHTNCQHDAAEALTPQAAQALAETDYENLTPEQVKEVVAQANSETAQEDVAIEQQYLQDQMEQVKAAAAAEQEIYDFLDKAQLPNTVNNVLAVQQMLSDRNKMFDTLWNAKGTTAQSIERIAQMKELILERFGESVKSPAEMADAQEALADVAEHVMDTMIVEDDHMGSIDIRALRLMNTQLGICAKQAQEENYMIPIQTGEGVTGVSLKIVRGTKEKGMVDILFHGSVTGKVAATFEAKEDGISGMLATDSEETRQLLSDHLGMLADALGDGRAEKIDLRVAKVSDVSLDHYTGQVASRNTGSAVLEENSGETDAKEESQYEVQTSRLYHIAESFLKTIQEFL